MKLKGHPMMKDMSFQFDMSARDVALWLNNKTKHTQDYLMAIPIDGLNQSVAPRQFISVLCYRLGIPLFVEGSLCLFCHKEMDMFGDHVVHCSHEVGLKYRHDLVRDAVADMCYRAGVPARKEVALVFLSNTGGALRPADVLVYNWENGRDTCLDVTIVSPFTGGGVRSFRPGHAMENVVTRKCNKHLDVCSSHGYEFGTLACSTLGELGSETVGFLKRLKNYLVRHDANANVGKFLFHRIGIVIQKGVGAQIVARLPTNFVKET